MNLKISNDQLDHDFAGRLLAYLILESEVKRMDPNYAVNYAYIAKSKAPKEKADRFPAFAIVFLVIVVIGLLGLFL